MTCCAPRMACHGSRLLKAMNSVVHLPVLVLVQTRVIVKSLSQSLDMLRSWAVVIRAWKGFDFGIDGLVQVAELELLLLRRVQQLLGARLGRVEAIVVLLFGRRRVVVVGHLREHPDMRSSHFD